MSDELGTCGRGALGTSTNCPVPDAGTLNRTQNRPSVPQGKQNSAPPDASHPAAAAIAASKKQLHPVSLYREGESSTFDKLQSDIKNLGIGYKIGVGTDSKNEPDAVYDPVNNEVRISKEGYDKYQKGDAEQLKRSIIHELVHARQYKELLGGEKDPNRRKQLIDKKVLSQKKKEYVKTMWGRELEAERPRGKRPPRRLAALRKLGAIASLPTPHKRSSTMHCVTTRKKRKPITSQILEQHTARFSQITSDPAVASSVMS